MDKFAIDVENFSILQEEYSDEQLATVEIYVCHDGNNRHNVPITREALINAKDTLKNKFLVAGFDGNDFEGHEPDEQIVGFFPESSQMKFVKKKGRTYLVAQAIMSKVYAKWAYDVFCEKGNHRDVSMEITVLSGQVDEYDNLLTIEEFVFNGVTILGLDHVPACEGSSASIIKFDCENALKVYNEHRDTTMVEFSGKEEAKTMDEKKEVVEEVVVETEEKEFEAETETTETNTESSKEDDNTMYSEDDKKEEPKSEEEAETPKEEKDFEVEEETKEEGKSEEEYESKEDVEKEVDSECKETEEVEAECKEEVAEVEAESEEENLPETENCEADKSVNGDEGEVSTEDYESVKAERDSLFEENKALKEKVEKYEEKEKSVEIESIISGVIDVFTSEEISALREEAQKFSLEELNIFDNEVKAKAFDKVKKTEKFETKKFTKVAINDVLDVNSKTSASKYTW